MTASDRNKTSVLVVLLIIGGFAYYYRVGFETVTAPATAPKAVSKAELQGDWIAEIDFNLIRDNAAVNVGQKDLFDYRRPPAPVKPPEIVTARGSLPTTPPTDSPPAPVVASLSALRYEGFSLTKETRKILASLREEGTTYRVKQGDYLLGHYWVTRITESLIELEDVQQKSRGTITIWR